MIAVLHSCRGVKKYITKKKGKVIGPFSPLHKIFTGYWHVDVTDGNILLKLI